MRKYEQYKTNAIRTTEPPVSVYSTGPEESEY
jgi:hypothetical protein